MSGADDRSRPERRAAEREAYRKDSVAEQGLASTIRKMIREGFTLMFPPNPPDSAATSLNITFGRVVEGVGFLSYNLPVAEETVKDDKELAIALAVALKGYRIYEAEALSQLGLPPREGATGKEGNGGGGGRKIILTDG